MTTDAGCSRSTETEKREQCFRLHLNRVVSAIAQFIPRYALKMPEPDGNGEQGMV